MKLAFENKEISMVIRTVMLLHIYGICRYLRFIDWGALEAGRTPTYELSLMVSDNHLNIPSGQALCIQP